MPYSMLQTALGALFFLIWFFIALMMLGDRVAENRRQRAANAGHSPLAGPHRAKRLRRQKKVAIQQTQSC